MGAKRETKRAFAVRLGVAGEKAILKSGQNPSDWLRQAADWRIEKEQAPEAIKSPVELAVGALKRDFESLKEDMRETRKEILRVQQAQTMQASELAAIKKMLPELQRSLIKLDQDFGDSLIELGASLLKGVDELLKAEAAARAEREIPYFPPPPPRQGL